MAQAKDKKDNKRKSTTKEKASPAKKKKVETKAKPKGKPVKAEKPKPAKKVIGSKVKKDDVKKKSNAQAKAKAVAKKPTKAVQKTARKVTNNDKKKFKSNASKDSVKKNVKAPVKLAVKTITRKAVAKTQGKPKVTAVKNKLKSVKKPTESKTAVKKTVKPSEKKVPEKPQKVLKKIPTTPVKQKKKPEPANGQEKAVKRKNTSQEDVEESPRKKRVITPNKKYADFEVGVSPKKVSELRAFLQDKKKEPGKSESKEAPRKKAKSAEKKEAATKKTEEETNEKIKVIKQSEMKPAEKLLKKLQKKLEKEAKAASVLKPENKVNKDKAKIKITKVVTYNKPPLLLKAKALGKNIAAKQKSPILKAAKAASTKAKAMVLKEKVASPAEKSKAADKGNKPTKNIVTRIVQTPDKAKAKKIKELKPEERPIHASFLYQKNVRFQDDPNQNCWITGIDVFPSGDIVLVDMGNKKIKLFSKEFQRLSQIKLDTIPQDLSISPIDASCAYFTKPFSKEGIQKVTLADGKLFLKESFWTNGTNRGITCTKAGILTSVQDGRYHDLDINCFKIDLLDYEGKILQSVSADQTGARLFKLPLYFSVSSTGKQIIVSDCIRYNSYIVSLDMSGKIKFKYTGIRDNLITPRGLTVDDEDNIYVTEWENHNVYVLSPTGKRLQLLFSHNELKAQGIDDLQKPYQLCYKKQEEGGQLIVSQEGCNTVKVFKVTKRSPEDIAKLVKEAEAAAAAAKSEKLEAKSNKGTPKTSDDAPKASDEVLPEDQEKVEDDETNGEPQEGETKED